MRMAAPSYWTVRAAVAVAGLLTAAGPVVADTPTVRIASAAVGLPSAAPPADPVAKFGAWAPLDLSLEVLADVTEAAELLVETPDADGVLTSLTVPLDLTTARSGTKLSSRDLVAHPYLRPAAGGGETTVTVRTTRGVPLSDPFRIRDLRPKPGLTYVVLGLGTGLPGFDLPRTAAGGAGEPEAGGFRGGRVETAAITDPGMLPDQWFGYDAADVVVLSTASADFLERLFGNAGGEKGRRAGAALREWVRRGGRLVVSVGPAAAGAPGGLHSLIPYEISRNPARQVRQLTLNWTARESSQTSTLGGNLGLKAGTFAVADFAPKPGRGGRVLIPPPNRAGDDGRPVAVQGGYGLGRVTLIAFDLDAPPFTEFGNRAEFWDWVLREGGAARASVGSEGKPRPASAGPTDEEDELAAALRTHADTFEGVPVISFGWVAVFIALYVLLIGPVEYYLLKRVLGRLELTWVTFPVIVLTVCVAAYLAASAAKGHDLRVNKIDVVDVVAETDPETRKPGGSVFGTTWLTVFSPTIDAYTVGVTPAEGWAAAGESGRALVGWSGGPRGGRASLLRRRYEYHTDPATGTVADGLTGVPVQVWSTKSFTANWSAAIDPAAPVVESRLVHPPGDPARAIGTFVNRMPFPAVTDCVAFYAGQAYPLGTILGGQEVRLVLDRGQPATQWLQDSGQLAEVLARAPAGGPAPVAVNRSGAPAAPTAGAAGALPLWGVLFHEAALRNDEGVIPRNASLRRLDQSWRLAATNRDEVIVVGRVLPPAGEAEPLFGGPDSPSRVRLKGLPGEGRDRPPVPGLGRLESYVRLYLPVRAAGAGP